MATRWSQQKGPDPKSGATNSPAPAPAPKDRFSQLEKQLAEIRDVTTSDVLEELRRLRYAIGDINRRFDAFDCTVEAFDDLRVKVDRHKAEMVELRNRLSYARLPRPQ